MKEIMMDIYGMRCRYYRKRCVEAMDNMEKYIYSKDNKQFQKNRKRYNKYKMKWFKTIEKHSLLIGA